MNMLTEDRMKEVIENAIPLIGDELRKAGYEFDDGDADFIDDENRSDVVDAIFDMYSRKLILTDTDKA